MKKYIVMGNYTAKAFQGFMKDPKQDRSIAVKALTEAVGGTFESFILREVLMISLLSLQETCLMKILLV